MSTETLIYEYTELPDGRTVEFYVGEDYEVLFTIDGSFSAEPGSQYGLQVIRWVETQLLKAKNQCDWLKCTPWHEDGLARKRARWFRRWGFEYRMDIEGPEYVMYWLSESAEDVLTQQYRAQEGAKERAQTWGEEQARAYAYAWAKELGRRTALQALENYSKPLGFWGGLKLALFGEF